MLTLYLLMVMFMHTGLAVIPKSKIKIQMDFIAAMSLTDQANLKPYRDALQYIMDVFELGPNYTTMTLFEYKTYIRHQFSLIDQESKARKLINRLTITKDDERSVMHDALNYLSFYSYELSEPTRLKVFLLMTQIMPTNGRGQTNYQLSELEARILRGRGTFFLVFDDQGESNQSRIDSLNNLTTKECFIHVKSASIKIQLAEKLVPTVMRIACEDKTRICRFTSQNRDVCENVWHYKSYYTDAEECHKLEPYDPPRLCKHDECFQQCDHYWPWSNDILCDCDVGLRRVGPNPFPTLLQFCPRVLQCRGCEATMDDSFLNMSTISMEINETDDTGASTQHTPTSNIFEQAWQIMRSTFGPLPIWAIGAIGFGTISFLLFVVFLVVCVRTRRRTLRRTKAHAEHQRHAASGYGTSAKSNGGTTKRSNKYNSTGAKTERGLFGVFRKRKHLHRVPHGPKSRLPHGRTNHEMLSGPTSYEPTNPYISLAVGPVTDVRQDNRDQWPPDETTGRTDSPSPQQPSSANAPKPYSSKSKQSRSTTQSKKPRSIDVSKKPPSTDKSKKPQSMSKSKKPQSPNMSKKPQNSINKSKKPPSTDKSKKPQSMNKSKKPQTISKSRKQQSISKSKKPQSTDKSKKPQNINKSKKPETTSKSKKPQSINKSKKPQTPEKSKKPQNTKSHKPKKS